jgi:benzoyl-CoA reductase/2-hydroxyglutaryl-CoA dehydratase subunit BcrC/BadD/HgdB
MGRKNRTIDKRLRGTITGFQGSWMSGIANLMIDGVPVLCDNGPTVRALEAAFGNVIDNAHCVNQEAIIGKEIYYSEDFMGMLEGFTPVEEYERGERG